MTDDRNDGLADVINLLAAPIAGGIRSMEQFRKGVDELWRAVDNLNTTLENLNEAATRINGLLADVEEPIRAAIPQLTRTIETADTITRQLDGPVRAAAPNIEKVVETLSSPAFTALPNQLGDFMNTMGDMSKRLGPLAQFAENAGGLFGGFKVPGLPSPGGAATKRPASQPAERPSAPSQPAAKKAPARKKKSPAKKKSAAKKK